MRVYKSKRGRRGESRAKQAVNNALTTERESHKKGKCAVLDERKVR